MPDLRELRVFVAVAEQLSFTRAAEQLHFTQQTVSKTVRDLERELGVALLERTSREVHLTAAGAALLGPGKEALAQANAAFDAARAVGTGHSGLVRIGVTPAVGAQDCADAVRALRERSARSVTLRDVRPGDLRQSLRDRTVDLVLARASGIAADALDRADLRPSRMQVHVPAGHPLASAATATLDAFDGERLLTASPRGTPYTDLLVARFAAAGATVTPVEARITGGDQLLLELVEAAAIAVMSAGTPSPDGVNRVDVPGFTMPLLVLWAAGRAPRAAGELREAMR